MRDADSEGLFRIRVLSEALVKDWGMGRRGEVRNTGSVKRTETWRGAQASLEKEEHTLS